MKSNFSIQFIQVLIWSLSHNSIVILLRCATINEGRTARLPEGEQPVVRRYSRINSDAGLEHKFKWTFARGTLDSPSPDVHEVKPKA